MRTRTQHLRGRAALAVASVAALAVALSSVGGAGAAAPQHVVTLGQTSSMPAPSCPATPTSDCQAVGKVTGFQTMVAGQKNVFKAPADGRIVKWSIRLSQPSSTPAAVGQPSELQFFNDFYGTPPKAGIAILRRVGTSSPPRFRLLRQSPVEDLTEFMSAKKTTTTFVLSAPLRVRAGDIVGLTIPTWAPAFAVNIASNNAWRASRAPARCNGADNIKLSRPHQTVRQIRAYGCLYKSARLLYTAGFIAS
jgi:hypothetical protein